MGNRSSADALLAGRGQGTGGGVGAPGAAAGLAGGVLLIGAVLAGNTLVCVSVAAERTLQTPTNYFIVSLAAADLLLLAVLVLPLFVHWAVQGGVWLLSPGLCDALMAMDALLCTASIFNLCAISVDRFVAVAVPLSYNRQSPGGRQLLLIGATWLLCGLDDARGRDPAVASWSSRSFFLPCALMLLLCGATSRGLRRWEAARAEPPPRAGGRVRATAAGRERKARRVLPVAVGGCLRRAGGGTGGGAQGPGSAPPPPRGLPGRLDALLRGAHHRGAVSRLRRASAAGRREQRPQPAHLHRLPQGPASPLLSRPRCTGPLRPRGGATFVIKRIPS